MGPRQQFIDVTVAVADVITKIVGMMDAMFDMAGVDHVRQRLTMARSRLCHLAAAHLGSTGGGDAGCVIDGCVLEALGLLVSQTA